MMESIELLELVTARVYSIDKVLDVRIKMAGDRIEIDEPFYAAK